MFTGGGFKQAVVQRWKIGRSSISEVEKSRGKLVELDSFLVFGMLAPRNQPSVVNGRSAAQKQRSMER